MRPLMTHQDDHSNSFYTNKNLEGILNSPDLEIVEEKSIGRDLKLVLRKKNAS